MLAGQVPFEAKNTQTLYNKIRTAYYIMPDEWVSSWVTYSLWLFAQSMNHAIAKARNLPLTSARHQDFDHYLNDLITSEDILPFSHIDDPCAHTCVLRADFRTRFKIFFGNCSYLIPANEWHCVKPYRKPGPTQLHHIAPQHSHVVTWNEGIRQITRMIVLKVHTHAHPCFTRDH